MTFILSNEELGLPKNATQEQRAEKIAALGGIQGMGTLRHTQPEEESLAGDQPRLPRQLQQDT